MNSQITLFETLQREFCPPLDSSLLAALLADIESDGEGNPIDPSAPQIHELRMTLGALSSQADESQWDEMSDLQLTEETCSTPDFYYGNTPTTSSLDSDSSGSSKDSFSSPLGFLQAALPHVSVQRLSQALADAEGNERDMDMWDIVATILTDESVREMEERGFAGLEDIEMGSMPPDDEIMWETVEKKKKPEQAKATKGKSSRSTKFTLVDVRQQQHRRPSKKGSAVHLLPDLWTQVSSLSAHLESLLPPHPSSFFQSYFHSPEYTTPYDALSAALTAISISQTPSTSDIHTSILFNLLDVLLPEYEDVDSLQRSRLISDTELSVKVTNGRGDDALDLVKLLRDLDSDSSSYLEMGIYHLPAPSPTKDFVIKRSLPAGPPIPQPPPPSTSRLRPPSPIAKKPSRFQWQDVPQRKIVDRAPHPLSPHIPAYSRDVNGIKVRGGGNGLGKGGKGDVGELAESRRRMTESMKKRNELLREASRMWQRGNARTRGGEVAFYFAEKAREFQELAMRESLNAARTMVESKRLTSRDRDTLDLHGTTVAEAVVIVKESLQRQGSSPSKPLKLITGRGSHSANQISVLKPAIKKALVDDGWVVGAWDGGLVVRGKRVGQVT